MLKVSPHKYVRNMEKIQNDEKWKDLISQENYIDKVIDEYIEQERLMQQIRVDLRKTKHGEVRRTQLQEKKVYIRSYQYLLYKEVAKYRKSKVLAARAGLTTDSLRSRCTQMYRLQVKAEEQNKKNQ